MTRLLLIVLSCLFLLVVFTQCNRSSVAASEAPEAKIERGRHIAESVGMCADCHTPRLPTGEFDRSKWMMGAILPFKPTIPMPFIEVAPPLAGLPTLPTDEQAIEFMMTGKRPSGIPVLPPMPPIRLSRDEAEAVVAYFRSLPTKP